MDTALLVANPAASGFTGGAHRDVSRILADSFALEAAWPRSADDATALVLEAVQAGISMIVAMGGDGIVHRVAQSVEGSPAVLGIIPAGTTNVVARLFGIPARPQAAAQLIAGEHLTAAESVVDVVLTRPNGDPVRVSGLFSIGAGFDALVVRAADSEPYRKYRFGGVHYARTAIGLARTELGGPLDVTVRSDVRRRQVEGALVQFRSAYTYFGRIPLRLSPDPPDPMTVALIEGLRLRQATALVRAAALGGDMSAIPGMHVWTACSEVEISAPGGIPVQVDGETYGDATQIRLRHRPAMLNVVIPPDET